MHKFLLLFIFLSIISYSQDEYSLNFNGIDSELNLGNPEWGSLSEFSVKPLLMRKRGRITLILRSGQVHTFTSSPITPFWFQ